MPRLPRKTCAAVAALLLTLAALAALPADDRVPARAFAELQSLAHGQ